MEKILKILSHFSFSFDYSRAEQIYMEQERTECMPPKTSRFSGYNYGIKTADKKYGAVKPVIYAVLVRSQELVFIG